METHLDFAPLTGRGFYLERAVSKTFQICPEFHNPIGVCFITGAA